MLVWISSTNSHMLACFTKNLAQVSFTISHMLVCTSSHMLAWTNSGQGQMLKLLYLQGNMGQYI